MSAEPVAHVRHAPQADLIVYFTADNHFPQHSGWRLHRLSDGQGVQIAEAQVPPYSACITPDGKKLAYITRESQAVQIDLIPAFERLKVWAGDVPDDRNFVPRHKD